MWQDSAKSNDPKGSKERPADRLVRLSVQPAESAFSEQIARSRLGPGEPLPVSRMTARLMVSPGLATHALPRAMGERSHKSGTKLSLVDTLAPVASLE